MRNKRQDWGLPDTNTNTLQYIIILIAATQSIFSFAVAQSRLSNDMASRRHTNFVAASILAQLKADLGEHAQNLQYTRLHDLIIKPLDNDPAAISFKLLFGSIRDQKTGKRDNVYIHLYPATTSGDRPEIQFHSYDQIRGTKAKLYGETIGRNVSAIASAFQIGSRRWSHSKLTALARYYFLEKLAEFQDEHDDEKLKFGLLISKSFKDDLRTVCREFQEARTHSHNPVISSAARISDTSQESELSSVPEDFDRNSKHPPVTLQERTARREEDTKSVEHLTRRQEDAVGHLNPTANYSD